MDCYIRISWHVDEYNIKNVNIFTCTGQTDPLPSSSKRIDMTLRKERRGVEWSLVEREISITAEEGGFTVWFVLFLVFLVFLIFSP